MEAIVFKANKQGIAALIEKMGLNIL